MQLFLFLNLSSSQEPGRKKLAGMICHDSYQQGIPKKKGKTLQNGLPFLISPLLITQASCLWSCSIGCFNLNCFHEFNVTLNLDRIFNKA